MDEKIMINTGEKKTKKQLRAESKRRTGVKRYWEKWREEHHDEIVEKNKKKAGRHKKPGPKKKYYKKKVKPQPKPPRKTWEYKIMILRSGREIKYEGKYHDIQEVSEAIARLKEKDNAVIFERKINNGGRGVKDYEEHYLIIQKNRNNETAPMLFRNQYGKLVEHTLNSDKWRIYDILPKKTEEEFWVYGLDPVKERRTFQWIYENVLLSNLETKFDIKRVIVYKNKVLFKSDDMSYDMIICKNEADAIRFYNLLEEWIKKNRQKQIYFLGNYSALSEGRSQLEDDIMKMTGWDKRRVQRKKT